MTSQVRNAALVSLLETDFIRRNGPGNLLGNVLNTYLALPGLRGFWPFSSVDENGDPYDLTMQGRTLTNNNTVTFNNTDFLPYAEFDGATNYLSRPDEAGLDITGDLTMGCWVYQPALANHAAMAKGTNVSNSNTAFRLILILAGNVRIVIGNGTTQYNATSTSLTSINTWHFTAARFTVSTEVAVWLNGEKDTNTTSIPASLNNSTLPLSIGSNGTPGRYFDGNIALPFLCAYALPDNLITNLYQQTRILFEDQ